MVSSTSHSDGKLDGFSKTSGKVATFVVVESHHLLIFLELLLSLVDEAS